MKTAKSAPKVYTDWKKIAKITGTDVCSSGTQKLILAINAPETGFTTARKAKKTPLSLIKKKQKKLILQEECGSQMLNFKFKNSFWKGEVDHDKKIEYLLELNRQGAIFLQTLQQMDIFHLRFYHQDGLLVQSVLDMLKHQAKLEEKPFSHGITLSVPRFPRFHNLPDIHNPELKLYLGDCYENTKPTEEKFWDATFIPTELIDWDKLVPSRSTPCRLLPFESRCKIAQWLSGKTFNHQ